MFGHLEIKPYLCISLFWWKPIRTTMFSSLSIKNYRGIREANIPDLSMVNLFFGKNNCGKSTVLESLFLISGQSNPSLPVTVNNMRGVASFSQQAMAVDFYGANPQNAIDIAVEGTERRSLHIEMVRSDSHEVALGELRSGKSDAFHKYYGLKASYSIGGSPVSYKSELIVSGENREHGRIGVDKRYKERLFSRYIPSGQVETGLARTFADVVKNKREAEVAEALRVFEPRLRDIQLVGDDLLVDMGFQQRLLLNVMGDGIRKVLSIILAIYECAGGILIVDELDNGLHFSVMEDLWAVIFSTASRQNVQLFASTHNIDLLKGLVAWLDTDGAACYREKVSAYKLIRTETDEIATLRYGYGQLSYSNAQELEVR